MVGLVIVSHSRALAEAACRLAKGVGTEELPIAFAGGTGEDFAELGTDATDIMSAVESVNSGDGVVVLMDLGSAVLSARLAEQMLEDEVPNIRLCPAPLVEGAVAAAVQIGIGAEVEVVCEEAKNALKAKFQEMSGDDGEEAAEGKGDASDAGDGGVPPDAVLFRFTMDDPNGMHTRPAAEFVKAVSGFHSEVRIRNGVSGGAFVNGRSLNQIALSNIRRGDISEVAVWGEESGKTVEALRRLVAETYKGREVTEKEMPSTGTGSAKAEESDLSAESATTTLARLSPGVAVGVLFLDDDGAVELPVVKVSDAEAEVKRLDEAVLHVRSAMDEQGKGLVEGHEKEDAILDAQRLILGDAEVLDDVKKVIRTESRDAASAYQSRMLALAKSYRALDDVYMRERAADIGGVAAQVLRALRGQAAEDLSHWENVVVWAPEISPAHIGRWKPGQLAAILTHEGGLTSHVAILAKAMNIPALMGYVPPRNATSGQRVAVDANRLEVVLEPDPSLTNEFVQRRDEWKAELARDLADSRGEAVTRDNVRVLVWANVGDDASVDAAVKNNAEGIGLLRTEFLFLDRRAAPSEEEQVRELSDLIRPFAALPVTVRTLDAGADKPMPWLSMPKEANPFLGVRGIRLVMAHPEIFRTQLRAILRAGAEAGVGDLRVMAPMIATVDEIAFAKKALNKAHAELEKEGCKHTWPVRFGIMIETPAAVLQAETFAGEVDFFSIGTNDLTQYVMCAERGSQALGVLSDSLHPAVLTAVEMVVKGAKRHGTEVAVCGEMAGDPVSALALVGLGVGHLSMSASAIGRVKRLLRQIDAKVMHETVGKALAMDSAADVGHLFGSCLEPVVTTR